MAFENLGKVSNFEAAGAINQFLFVAMASTGLVDKVAVAGGASDGVIQNNPKTGSASGDPHPVADVMIGPGITKIVAGAAFSVNASLASDNQGRAVLVVTGGRIQGKAMQAATAAGDIIAMEYYGAGSQRTAP